MRFIAIIAAAAMVAAFFLPWISFGPQTLIPWDLVKNVEPSPDGLRQLTNTLPWQMVLLLATFPLAALFLVLALVGLPLRPLAFVTGAIPVVTIGYGLWKLWSDANAAAATLGVESPGLDVMAVLRDGAASLSSGAWAWGVGAVLLFLAGLVGFGRRR